MAKNKNIIAIASGKGGVGKTWFAITLSHLLSRAGRRVLLFDGDIGLANVDVQLGLTPHKDLGTVFSGKHVLKEVITHYEEGGFDIIAGRSGSSSMASLPLVKLKAIREDMIKLANEYDYILLDLGAGVEQNVQFLTSMASQCLVVITDEPTSLTDAYAFIKLCSMQPEAPSMQVVVNQAATQKEGSSTYGALNNACNSFLNISPPCIGIIRKDNKVKESIKSQVSLISKAPHCTAATDMAAISIKIMQPK